MTASDVRYQQDRHGFVKLTPVKREAAGWRRSLTSEYPDAIVSRVFGPSAFAIVTNGEIDGLLGLIPGTVLGVTPTGPIAVGGTPAVAKATSTTALVVNLQSYAGATASSSSDAAIRALQLSLASLSVEVDDLATSTAATDVDLQAQITALSTSLVATVNFASRQYAWSVAS